MRGVAYPPKLFTSKFCSQKSGGLYDLKEMANKDEMYEINDGLLLFMDGKIFAAEGMDLRAGWLESRKKAGVVLWMNRTKSSTLAKRLYLSNGETRQLAEH